MERFGKKSYDNLINAINESKHNNLDKLLFGLGIRHVGSKTAKLICQKFKTLDKIMEASYEEIASIAGVGEVIALAVREYFDNFDYIIGDYAYNKLRLKGFCKKENKNCNEINTYEKKDEYISNFCAYDARYFVLERVK